MPDKLPPGSKPSAIMIALGTPKDGKQPPPDRDPEPDQIDEDQDDGQKAVPPEAVSCHTAQEACSNCEYADQDMYCSWLKQQVGDDSPSGIIYCRLFEAKGGSEPDENAPPQM